MITRLNFKNLRCFSDFTIEEVTPVTLISGKNNVGKTTLLEGIFLLFDHLDPGVFFKLNGFRGNPVSYAHPQILWEPLFNEVDPSKELSICVENDGVKQSLRLQKDDQSALSTFVPKATSGINDQNRQQINSYPLKVLYSNGDYNESGSYNIAFPGVSINLESQPRPADTHIHYIGNSIILESPNLISEWFGRLELAKQKQRLVQILRIMDGRVRDLFTVVSGGVGYIYADTDEGIKMPLQVMGEGMNKLLFIALNMLANPGSILLIDEVENGFHYSFHATFWKLIFELSRETNCQVFATTHSYECISGAADAVAETSNGDILSYVRLGRKKGEISPHFFSKESLAFALQSEMEVR